MKLHRIILTVAAVALALGATAADKKTNKNAEDPARQEVILENIMTRTSVRKFEPNRPVEEAKVEKMLRAAMAAPTAANQQPWVFIVVTDPNLRKGLAEVSSRIVDKAPLVIVVCGNMDRTLEGVAAEVWVQDCSAASENILLAAHALGLGAVWIGAYPDEQRSHDIAKVLKLPDSIVPLNAIVIGYPAGENKPKDKWEPKKVGYNDTFDPSVLDANPREKSFQIPLE